MLHLRVVVLVTAALAMLGCSTATRFGYNHLDWFAKRELGKYIDLTDTQEAWLQPRFEALWAWHRTTQLPRYAEDLYALADAAEQPLTAEQFDNAFKTLQDHADRVYERATPEAVTLLAMLSNQQVDELLDTIAEDTEDFADEVAKHDVDHRREEKVDDTLDWLDKRLGRLTDAQRETVNAWSHTREDLSEQWLAHARWWHDAFAETLADRLDTGFAERAAALLFQTERFLPDALADANARNRQRWLGMLATVSAQSTPRQRQHLAEYIREFAKDFAVLAEQPVD